MQRKHGRRLLKCEKKCGCHWWAAREWCCWLLYDKSGIATLASAADRSLVWRENSQCSERVSGVGVYPNASGNDAGLLDANNWCSLSLRVTYTHSFHITASCTATSRVQFAPLPALSVKWSPATVALKLKSETLKHGGERLSCCHLWPGSRRLRPDAHADRTQPVYLSVAAVMSRRMQVAIDFCELSRQWHLIFTLITLRTRSHFAYVPTRCLQV